MPKYKIYHDDVLATDPTLNKLTDYYYPGTIWDYYEEGAYGPYNVSVPVNRRNPSNRRRKKGMSKEKREKLSRVMSRAQQIATAAGCDFRTAMLEAWAEEKARSGSRAAANPRKYKNHSTKVHQYRNSAHAARAKQAMQLKHQLGISLKEAWAMVKSGQTSAAANPRVTWPRRSQYQEVEGTYGPGMSIPVNRRNPRQSIGRYHRACPNCGGDTYGKPIAVVGKGPQGGKIWACC